MFTKSKLVLSNLSNLSQAYAADSEGLGGIWSSIKDRMYVLTDRQKQLGLGAKGVTKYFSDNCDQEDSNKINRSVEVKDLANIRGRFHD